ncbi:phosphatidylserine decarboxylase family protein [bacterium]|nr:phosphatidylserine decarboxylase family protein [bacterium]
MSIAREGLPYYGGSFILSLLFCVLGWFTLGILCMSFCLFALFFFRDPVRQFAGPDNAFLSPADGKIIAIQHVDHDLFNSGCLMISIFMSIFDVHINRCPYSGTVQAKHYRPGRFLPAYREQAIKDNEHNELWIESDHFSYVVNQIAGIVARRIRCWVNIGDTVARGQKIGLIQFGSRVDVYVPSSFRCAIEHGEQVYGGKTVLGYPAELQEQREADHGSN